MQIAVYNRNKKWLTVYDEKGARICRYFNAIMVSISKGYTEVSFQRAGDNHRIAITNCVLIREDEEV